MCGRFTVTGAHDIAREFQAELDGGTFQPRFNVAPTQRSYCLRVRAGRRVIQRLHWGFWGPKGLVINARSERAPASLMFADSFFQRRCGVVTDGFIEWSGRAGSREPYWLRRPDKRPVLLAGLWRRDVDPNTTEARDSFVVVTTAANDLVATIHDRMPAVLRDDDVETWLRPAPSDPRERPAFIAMLSRTLRPADERVLSMHPISTRINGAAVDDPGCLEPRAEQQRLF
ncbi:MAG: SOS response-associated peptidase [Myxococcales bacterium FL481]|nr:MAG: SOS response-associated peptidase [Myxococcales bacterium FL481]